MTTRMSLMKTESILTKSTTKRILFFSHTHIHASVSNNVQVVYEVDSGGRLLAILSFEKVLLEKPFCKQQNHLRSHFLLLFLYLALSPSFSRFLSFLVWIFSNICRMAVVKYLCEIFRIEN